MESEVELDEEVKKLHVLAATPELYPSFVKLGTMTSLIQLLLHENVGTRRGRERERERREERRGERLSPRSQTLPSTWSSCYSS